jgi:hypothetical protein
MEGDGANSTCVALCINRYRAKGWAMHYTRSAPWLTPGMVGESGPSHRFDLSSARRLRNAEGIHSQLCLLPGNTTTQQKRVRRQPR